MTDDILSRLAAVERRLDELQAAPVAPSASADEDPLWVLNGIKGRLADIGPDAAAGAIFYAGSVRLPMGPVEWQIGAATDDLLADDWSRHAASLAALGNPVRLELLHAMLNGASSVADLAEIEGLGSTGQLYHHITQLTAHGWLTSAGRGKYAVPAERVVPLLVILTAVRR